MELEDAILEGFLNIDAAMLRVGVVDGGVSARVHHIGQLTVHVVKTFVFFNCDHLVLHVLLLRLGSSRLLLVRLDKFTVEGRLE